MRNRDKDTEQMASIIKNRAIVNDDWTVVRAPLKMARCPQSMRCRPARCWCRSRCGKPSALR
jgi:hypothetical protein